MEQTIKDFENLLLQRFSRMTVRAYGWELRRLAAKYPSRQALDFRARDLNQYLAERRLFDGVGDAAVKRGVSAFKKFFLWLHGTKKKSPANGLEFPRVVHVREPRTLTDAQLDSVLLTCDTSTVTGKRNIALIGLMVDARLRASEVCRLRLVDLDFDARRLSVIVKRNKRHIRKFAPETRALLESWLSVRSSVLDGRDDPGTVFLGVGGEKRGSALTSDGLRAIFRRIGKRAGLVNGFSPHDLCRTFATETTLKGAPSRTVQVGGGWSNMDLVQLYTRALDIDAIDDFLPMRGRMG